MTDKERLEEIKGIVSTWKTILSESNYPDVMPEEIELFEEVIHQAERAQKLEKQIKLYDFFYTAAYEQNKRYREYLGRLQRATNRYPAEDMAYVVNKIISEALEVSE